METIRPILAEQPFFTDMDPYLLDLLAGSAFEERFAAGDTIFFEGGDANRFYLLLEGRVALETMLPDRDTVEVDTLEAGEPLGWSWLYPPYIWHFSARALEPVAALAFDARSLRAQCEADHDLGYALMRRISAVIIRRLQATRMRLVDTSRQPGGQQSAPADPAPVAGGRG